MTHIGRNDPCPCGSGKKYKRCCGDTVVDSVELTYLHLRRLEGETTEKLLRFAKGRFGEKALEEAWGDYWLGDSPPLDLEAPEFHPFTLWFLSYWKPSRHDDAGKQSVLEAFLREKGRNLGLEEYRFLDLTLKSPYSFYQVLESTADVRMRLRDVLRKTEIEVQEKAGSRYLKKGLLILARIVEMDGIALMMGCGTQPIMAHNIDALMTVRKELEKGHPGDRLLSAETLRSHEEDLREFYFDLCDGDRNRKLKLSNTDGEPLVLQTLTYRVPSATEAFQALKGLQQKTSGETDEELLGDAERSAGGEIKKITLHWLKKGNRKNPSWENTSLATLSIEGTQMQVDVNSAKRAARIKREIDKRLGSAATLVKTDKQTTELMMKRASKGGGREPSGRPENDESRRLAELPEVQSAVKQMMDRHWETWPDHPLPALKGMTPRQAAKHPEGRELLEALLLHFESENDRQSDPLLCVDIEKLKQTLGI